MPLDIERRLANLIARRTGMPLVQSASEEAFGENVKREMEAGKPQKQAVAIAYDVQGRNDSAKRIDAFCDAVGMLCHRTDSLMGSVRRDSEMQDLEDELDDAEERGDKEAVIRLREKIAMHKAGESA